MSTRTFDDALYALIMAGGSGTRFWPASRHALPKQFLKLAGDRTMIQETLERLDGLVPADHTLVMTNQRLVETVATQLPGLNAAAILGEPCKRDTAPCIGLAAALLVRRDHAATMLVMPSDHVIAPIQDFQAAIRHAHSLVQLQPERLVTFGISPTYPAESFGYIERGPVVTDQPLRTFRVQRFHEKPKAAVAQQYLASGTFYWNSGIFVWRAATLLEHLQQREPEMLSHLQTIADAYGQATFADVFAREFPLIQGRSIDYAVMEQARDVLVIEAPFQWDDVGSWQAITRLNPRDPQGNVVTGRNVLLDTNNSIIRADDGHVIVTIGLKDYIVVHTPDATLVAAKDQEERVRQVVQELEQRGWQDVL